MTQKKCIVAERMGDLRQPWEVCLTSCLQSAEYHGQSKVPATRAFGAGGEMVGTPEIMRSRTLEVLRLLRLGLEIRHN